MAQLGEWLDLHQKRQDGWFSFAVGILGGKFASLAEDVVSEAMLLLIEKIIARQFSETFLGAVEVEVGNETFWAPNQTFCFRVVANKALTIRRSQLRSSRREAKFSI